MENNERNTQRSEPLPGEVTADIHREGDKDVISLTANPVYRALLIGGLVNRDDFQELLTRFGAEICSGIDWEGYRIDKRRTAEFLEEIRKLIYKHFPKGWFEEKRS